MDELNYILISDGSSDSILLSIIKWALNVNYPELPTNGKWADLRGCNGNTVPQKLKFAQQRYKFDILFYHRDAESCNICSLKERREEIYRGIKDPSIIQRTVCIIPIKMMETWLLFNTDAIKKASGNRNYRGAIDLPSINKLEKLSQPKGRLHQLLKDISGLKGRNLDKFNPHSATHRVAEYIDDFSPLRQLEAFRCFEKELKTAINTLLNS